MTLLLAAAWFMAAANLLLAIQRGEPFDWFGIVVSLTVMVAAPVMGIATRTDR